MRLQQPARDVGDLAAGEAHAAGGRIDQADDAARHGRFARAALADDAERAALAQRQRDLVGGDDFAAFAEERALAVDLAELVGLQHHRFLGLGPCRARHQARHRGEQVAGVLHGRIAQDGVERSGLDQSALPHHRDAVGDLGDHAHVMGDEQHGGAVIALEIADQGQNLLLRGDVERGGRLVRDEQLRFEHERHRDHDALALTAGESVRVGGEDALDLGQAHLLHHVEDALLARLRIEFGVRAQNLVDLAANRHHRIERRHRLLEDHRHLRRAELPQAAVGRGENLFADQLDAAAGRNQRALRQQTHRGQRGHRLARAAFADEAQRLALVHLDRDAVDDVCAFGFLPTETTRLLMSRTGLVIT